MNRCSCACGRSHRQLGVDDLLIALRATIQPHAFMIVGITVEDLYSEEPDLFVAGMADAKHAAVCTWSGSVNRWEHHYARTPADSLLCLPLGV